MAARHGLEGPTIAHAHLALLAPYCACALCGEGQSVFGARVAAVGWQEEVTPSRQAREAGSGRRAAAIFSAGRSGAGVSMPAEKMAVDGPEQVRPGWSGVRPPVAGCLGRAVLPRGSAGPGCGRGLAGTVTRRSRLSLPEGAGGRPGPGTGLGECGTRIQEGIVRRGKGCVGGDGETRRERELGGCCWALGWGGRRWVGGKARTRDLTREGWRGK